MVPVSLAANMIPILTYPFKYFYLFVFAAPDWQYFYQNRNFIQSLNDSHAYNTLIKTKGGKTYEQSFI